MCVSLTHKKHDLISLKIHQEEIEKRLKENLSNIDEISSRVHELKLLSRKKKSPPVLSLKESINKKCIDSNHALVNCNTKLLREANMIESARSGGIWDTVSAQIDVCRSMLGKADAAEQYYDNVTECENAMEAVTKLRYAVSDEGVLTCIDNLEVKFVPTPEISLGHIEEPTGWRLVKKIDLPEDKADQMNECIALSGRRVAVGYGYGGVDIIGIDDEQRVRILDDTKIYGLTGIGNYVLAVCTTSTKLFTYNINNVSDEIYI